MRKSFDIDVDCANCANEMQEAASQVPGVSNVIVNFMTQKMIVDFDENADAKLVMIQVREACKRVEPDCEVSI